VDIVRNGRVLFVSCLTIKFLMKYFPTLVRRFSPDCKSKEEISELSKESATIANFDFYLKESEDLLCIAGFDGFYKESILHF
jgi:hypothetical protein